MPMYEYRCEQCGKQFEQLRRMSEADTGVVCPACQSQDVARLLSTCAFSGGSASGGGAPSGGCGGRGGFS
ncbi:MAG: zinc ribbon domain-containing protein [Bryobacter sp.]|nr:zinc ribbon domain-containing protein [Bryobacter sp.]